VEDRRPPLRSSPAAPETGSARWVARWISRPGPGRPKSARASDRPRATMAAPRPPQWNTPKSENEHARWHTEQSQNERPSHGCHLLRGATANFVPRRAFPEHGVVIGRVGRSPAQGVAVGDSRLAWSEGLPPVPRGWDTLCRPRHLPRAARRRAMTTPRRRRDEVSRCRAPDGRERWPATTRVAANLEGLHARGPLLIRVRARVVSSGRPTTR
jgi:hypothetical protein